MRVNVNFLRRCQECVVEDAVTNRQANKNNINLILVLSILNYACWYNLLQKIEKYKKVWVTDFVGVHSKFHSLFTIVNHNTV